jgi:hypothetical protein
VSRGFFFIPSVNLFRFSKAASVAFLHPHSFVGNLSLGAIWAYSFQQVLQPDNRFLLPSRKGVGPGLRRSHLISAVELGCSVTNSKPLPARLNSARCTYRFANTRRCRLSASNVDSTFCPSYARRLAHMTTVGQPF